MMELKIIGENKSLRITSATTHLRLVLAILLISCFLGTSQGQSAPEKKVTQPKVNTNGGYDLVFAIAKGETEPENVTNFLLNIESNLRNFSNALHKATKGAFFVNSVDLIVPYHWEFWDPTKFGDGTASKVPATWQSYENADVKLSRAVSEPQVENPNVCGLPGEFIALPLDFFQGEKFGPPHKAFLNAFARYRWGTWEESGYPGDQRFPYFYKKRLEDPQWQAVGCSTHGNLTGEIQILPNRTESFDSDADCPLDDELYPPGSDCRFYPDVENSDPTSSISYLPWLDSVVEFCDGDNHNMDAPNKQNIYCGYQSIQQIVKSSPDFSEIIHSSSTPSSEVTDTWEEDTSGTSSDDSYLNTADLQDTFFSVKVATKHPLFYLLVDSGRFNIPSEPIDKILEEVKLMLADEKFEDIISSAGTFNAKTMSPASSSWLQGKVEWSPMTDTLIEFNAVVDEFKSQGEGLGNFALALEQVVTMLRARAHSEGAIVLVLKHGASSQTFGKSVFESDLLALLQQSKINLHAIEIQQSALNPQVHLKNLAEGSGGSHALIQGSTQDISAVVRTVRRSILDNLEKATVDQFAGTLFKGFLPSSSNISVPLHQASLPVDSQLHFSLTLTENFVSSTKGTTKFLNVSPSDLNAPALTLLEGPENAPDLKLISQDYEWTEQTNGASRQKFVYSMNLSRSIFPTPWKFEYDGCRMWESEDVEICSSAFLVITYALPADATFIPGENLQVSTWTSIKVNEEPSLTLPLTLYAKILQNGSPLQLYTSSNEGTDKVIATLHSFDRMTSVTSILLQDDGANSVDISSKDGIYSGILSNIPLKNGLYRLTIQIQGDKVTSDTDEEFLLDLKQNKDSAIHRLLPMDQQDIGCRSWDPGCSVVSLERSTVYFVDHPQVIQIDQAETFKAQAARITDLTAATLDDYFVHLTWHEPALFVGLHEKIQVTDLTFEYDLRTSTVAEQLKTLAGFEGAHVVSLSDEVKEEVNKIDLEFGGGQRILKNITIRIEDGGSDNSTRYYALRLKVGHLNPGHAPMILTSLPSNTVGVIPSESGQEMTTTTTTTGRPPTTTTGRPIVTRTTINPLPESSDWTSSTTEEPRGPYWYEKVEAIITFSVFGAGILILCVGLIAYCYKSQVKSKSKGPTVRNRNRNRSESNNNPYANF